MRKMFFALSVSFIVVFSNAQMFQMVSGTNNNILGSLPENKVTIGNWTYFAADDGIHGKELWKTDGTIAGTQMVKDIFPGWQTSSLRYLARFKDKLTFVASATPNNYQMWVSDGTNIGTIPITNLNDIKMSGGITTDFYKPVVYKNYIYFFANFNDTLAEVWKTNGDTTLQIIPNDRNAGSYYGYSGGLASTDTGVFFISCNGNCYFNNGTDTAAQNITNYDFLYPQVSKIDFYKSIGLFFTIEYYTPNSIFGNLYKYKGSQSLQLINQGVFKDATYFYDTSSIINKKIIYATYSSTNGTFLAMRTYNSINPTLIKNINLSGAAYPNNFTTYQGKVYFTADDGINGRELWVTDFTSAGTKLVKDIASGKQSAFDYFKSSIYVFNNKLYFGATNGIDGFELWESDGTNVGTAQLSNSATGVCFENSYPSYYGINNGKLIYTAIHNVIGSEITTFDPANGNINSIDIRSGANEIKGSSIGKFTADNISTKGDSLIYPGYEPTTGSELYVNEGVTGSSKQLKDINIGCGVSTKISNAKTVGGITYFTAYDSLNGTELWRTDGTTNGTYLLKDIWAGSTDSSNIFSLTEYKNKLLFIATDNTKKQALWSSDGSISGTNILFYFDTAFRSIGSMFNFNDTTLYLSALKKTSNLYYLLKIGSSLTQTDTVIRLFNSPALNFIKFNNDKFTFISPEPLTRYYYVIWISNGTALTTRPILFNNYDASNYYYTGSNFFPISDNNVLYFTANSVRADTLFEEAELWRTDGTDSGTYRIKQINTTRRGSYPQNFYIVNHKLIFIARSPIYGWELWQSDGTDSGTTILKDICPGINSGIIYLTSTSFKNKIYFAASETSEDENQKTWVTDGTSTGTQVFSDVGGINGNIYKLISSKNKIYAIASNNKYERELWCYTLNDSAVSISGMLKTPNKKVVSKATLKLFGDLVANSATNVLGEYSFNLPKNGNYTIRPTKNNDSLKANGVTILDVIQIQNHILNKVKLAGAYKLIAADVNNSKTITVLDVIGVKKLILGLDTTFTGNRLWAFVDSAYQFPDTTNPFPYKDSISFTNLTSNKTNQTFIGVKLGDVNYDWKPAVAKGVAANNVELIVNDKLLMINDKPEINLQFTTNNFQLITGFQYTLHFDNAKYELVEIRNNKLDIEYNATQANATGNISFLWADKNSEPVTLANGSELFTLVLKAKAAISEQEIRNLKLEITNSMAEVEAWDKDFTKHNITLTHKQSNTAQPTTNYFAVYPNPSKGSITIATKGVKQIEVIDVMGRMVKIEKLKTNAQFSTFNSQLSTGVYVVKALMQDGSVKNEKLVVE